MSDSLGFLLSDVSRLMRRRFDERARQVGATRAQWRTLVTLSRNEGLNQGALADLLEVEPITLCRMIDRLEESGLVERRRDPADRRAWQLFLTGKSKPMLADLKDMGDELIEQVLSGIDAHERVLLGRSLELMRANLLASPSPRTSETAHG
ncbi:MarR family winged helix-turn-helix transcriptional regulator [Sphingomonas sp.]|jgi:DNA-binding MarR family transcriptional regulator|uniref:MarR family winged helix-turn-helix transcriptional regulator n=1 Tax=Sphingomonas sp. TaxID=28214 RepID=UPI002E351A89|nr:MarR family transcriptional regulator [Sphingomonas sp.]HEX4693493.1 MarR family transcriptional regulator [Sphingomonas sp.]